MDTPAPNAGTIVTQPTTEQMPLWDERNRGIPRTFARSALFSVGGKRERKILQKQEIASTELATLVYTGEELRTDDEDVLIQLFHLARGSTVDKKDGICLRFSGHQMLRELGWKVSQEGYTRLKACLTRMQNGSLHQTMVVRRRKVEYSGQIIRKWMLLDDEEHPKQQWRVWLEPEIHGLFEPNYALLEWNERMLVSKPISRWLHTFMATVKRDKVFVVPEKIVFKLSGSAASTMPKFRQLLKEALKEMHTERLIFDWKLFDGMLYVARELEQDINRATNAAVLAYEVQQQEDDQDEAAIAKP
jgi:hypothetical protein